MNLRVKKVDVQILLVIFLFLEPWWLTTVKIVDLFYNLGKLVVCCWVVLYLLKTKFMLSKLSCLFITYRIYICVISAYRGVFDIGYLSESLQYICFFVLLDYFILKYKIRILKLVVLIMCMLLVFNLITYTPSGIIFEADSGYYLLGIRTRIAELAVPAMGLVLYLVKQTKKHRILLFFVYISAISFYILEWVATALTCTILFFVLLISEKIIYKKVQNAYHIILIIVLVTISLGVVLFNVQELFADLITDLLHKRADLTGRTDIWYVAIPEISRYLILGHGFQNQGNFVSLYDFTTTAHNQWLQTMFYGGIVGSILFYLMPILSLKNCIQELKKEKNISIFIITLSVIIVICTTEIVMDNIYYLIFIICMYRCREFSYDNEKS